MRNEAENTIQARTIVSDQRAQLSLEEKALAEQQRRNAQTKREAVQKGVERLEPKKIALEKRVGSEKTALEKNLESEKITWQECSNEMRTSGATSEAVIGGFASVFSASEE
mgnify:CR=1 FL=1